MLDQCWSSVIYDGTTFNQHWFSASCWQVCRYCLLKELLQTRRRQWHQRKGSMYLIYKWANTVFWQRCGRKSQLKSSKHLVYQGAENTFLLCTGRTNVKRKLTTDICPESQPKNLVNMGSVGLEMVRTPLFTPLHCMCTHVFFDNLCYVTHVDDKKKLVNLLHLKSEQINVGNK